MPPDLVLAVSLLSVPVWYNALPHIVCWNSPKNSVLFQLRFTFEVEVLHCVIKSHVRGEF